MSTLIFVVLSATVAIVGSLLVSRLIYKKIKFGYRSYKFSAYPEVNLEPGKEFMSNFAVMIPTRVTKDEKRNPMKIIDYSNHETAWDGYGPHFEIISTRTKKPTD